MLPLQGPFVFSEPLLRSQRSPHSLKRVQVCARVKEAALDQPVRLHPPSCLHVLLSGFTSALLSSRSPVRLHLRPPVFTFSCPASPPPSCLHVLLSGFTSALLSSRSPVRLHLRPPAFTFSCPASPPPSCLHVVLSGFIRPPVFTFSCPASPPPSCLHSPPRTAPSLRCLHAPCLPFLLSVFFLVCFSCSSCRQSSFSCVAYALHQVPVF